MNSPLKPETRNLNPSGGPFTITGQPLDPEHLKAAMANPAAGAFASFEGWVRDHNDGKPVGSLEYEAFVELAVREGGQILAEVRAQHEVLDLRCAHRVGHLRIGELAVWVGATARHRDAAFQACRAVIDAVKARVPIWKKEHYRDGTAAWVACTACAEHERAHEPPLTPALSRKGRGGRAIEIEPVASDTLSPRGRGPGEGAISEAAGVAPTEADFYRRQKALASVGEAGQARLKAARVLVIGAGGLGCPALRYLAAAGVGHLDVCDPDRVEVSNLHRQVLFDVADVGQPKAAAASNRIREQNPFIESRFFTDCLGAGNAAERIKAYDVVLECTDNFGAKFLIHDACFQAGVPLVAASIYQFEGQLQVFRPGADAGCLRCLWPEAPQEHCVGACAEVGVLGVVPGVLGALQASETLKLLLGLPGVCDRETVLVDLLANETRHIARPRNPHCPLCGTAPLAAATGFAKAMPVKKDCRPPVTTEIPGDLEGANPLAPEAPRDEDAWIVDARTLTPERLAAFQVVDIRGAEEREGNPAWIQRLPNVPWTDLAALAHLAADKRYLLACAHGVRSRNVTARLRQAGHRNFFSLHQGIAALAAHLDRR